MSLNSILNLNKKKELILNTNIFGSQNSETTCINLGTTSNMFVQAGSFVNAQLTSYNFNQKKLTSYNS